MVKPADLRVFPAPPARQPPPLSEGIQRTRPRDFVEWRTLRRWGRLPPWETDPFGYLLRDLRETARLTQKQLAGRLGCSQQAIAQAERWDSNPSVAHLRRWACACGQRLRIDFE